MSGPKDAILKRWHAARVSPQQARRTWAQPYWREQGEFREVDCRQCPRFVAVDSVCGIRFGTPLRKCAIASIEAHLHDSSGEEVLEIGYGRLPTARNLIRRAGGRWTGIDPGQPRDRQPRLGRGGYGQAAEIPFPDQTFDRVFGVQTFEHWGQRANARIEPSEYGACLAEVWRVLKPGGRLYLDAPMHFHGHEMFIMGDVERILSLFDSALWQDLTVERWRREHAPLPAYLPSAKIQSEWPMEISSYPPERVQVLRGTSIWLLVVNARKRN